MTVVYTMAGLGSLAAGWMSSSLIARGYSVNCARKTTFGGIALLMPLVIFAAYTDSAWTAVVLIGFAVALHQGFSTTVFTMASDLVPARAVGSVIGIGGALAGVCSIAAAEYTGRILLQNPGRYRPMFVVAGLSYLVCLLSRAPAGAEVRARRDPLSPRSTV